MRPGFLRRVAGAFRGWQERRQAWVELNRLDDHILKDIGFRRDELVEVLRNGGRPVRPAHERAEQAVAAAADLAEDGTVAEPEMEPNHMPCLKPCCS